MSDISPPRRSFPPRALAALLLVIVALAGAAAGAVVDRLVVRRTGATLTDTSFHPLSQTLRAPTDADRRHLREQLSHELGLSAAQDSTIDSIMRHRAGEFNALRDEMRPRVERLVQDVRVDIEQVLTPEQRVRFRAMQQSMAGGRPRNGDLQASGTPAATQP